MSKVEKIDLIDLTESGGSGDAHNKGWFATPEALRVAHPTADNGDYAIVGSTDSVWVWDSDTTDWKDTKVVPVEGANLDLSNLSETGETHFLKSSNLKTINSSSLVGSGDISIKTYSDFPNDFVTSGTLQQVANSMVDSSGSQAGKAYLGGISGACMPWPGGGNAECKVEFMSDGLAVLSLSSADVAPYKWEYNTASGDYKWRKSLAQMEVMPTSNLDLAVGVVVQYVGTTNANYTNGYFYKCVYNGETYSWVQTNTQPEATYTAGANVQINDNVISATDTTYTAGTNVTIDANNQISATDTTYTAGANVTIVDNVISATGGGTTYTADKGLKLSNNAFSVAQADESTILTDYTLVGTPTITNGVATNFAIDNYVTKSAVSWDTSANWELVIPVLETDYNVDEFSGIFYISGANDSYSIRLQFSGNNVFFRVFDSTTTLIGSVNAYGVEEGVKTYIKVEYDTTAGYTVSTSTEGATWTVIGTIASTTPMDSTAKDIYVGIRNSNTWPMANGSIYLNETYIKSGSTYVWRPYTEATTVEVAKATTQLYGLVKPDGTTVTVNDGVISSTGTTYTAGQNIQINNDVISATDTTYTAGNNVQINNNVISATDTTYTESTGIKIDNSQISIYQEDGGTWTQPVLTEAGTMGVSDMACTQSASETDYEGWHVFDNDNSTQWQINTTATGQQWLSWYTSTPIRVKSLTITNGSAYGAMSVTVQGSNDNDKWFTIGGNSVTPGPNATYTVSLSSSAVFNYYKLNFTVRSGGFTIRKIQIVGETGVEKVARATDSLYGLVKPDGTSITISNGIITASSLSGLTSTIAELNYTDGVTSNIQTQLDGKQDVLTTIAGYDATKTQILKNVQGTFTWVDEA